MKVYNYDEITKEYVGFEYARLDPLEKGRYLIPRNSTTKEPKPGNDFEINCFDGQDWTLYPDYRYEKAIKGEDLATLYEVKEIGALKEGFVLIDDEQIEAIIKKQEQARLEALKLEQEAIANEENLTV
ncbi:MAG: hypothetical protein BWY78_00643 [Alphaproteobacteria bacterium ADurb.Bin438]|nr:MAG: hypothetical protein BWY78_00643 [Alphaproteobacteria bacterium ADurb.Bin438]